jgi:hypothetical protein
MGARKYHADLFRVLNTRNKSGIIPSTHVFFCLLYKGHAVFEKR